MPELVIAGFHRSGTSLVSELLNRAGLFLGDDMIGAHPSNPYGHFEDRDFTRFHNGLFSDNKRSWHITSPFIPYIAARRWRQMSDLVETRRRTHQLWGFKDPRACLFLTAWKYVMPDMKVLLVYRHFSESAYSLERRHSVNLFEGDEPQNLHRRFWDEADHALRMWIQYNRALLDFQTAYPDDTLVVGHTALAAGAPIVSMINERWGLDLRPVPTNEVFDPAVTGRRDRPQPLSDPGIGEEALAVWAQLRAVDDTLSQPDAEVLAATAGARA